jgi:hypothetical protein
MQKVLSPARENCPGDNAARYRRLLRRFGAIAFGFGSYAPRFSLAKGCEGGLA